MERDQLETAGSNCHLNFGGTNNLEYEDLALAQQICHDQIAASFSAQPQMGDMRAIYKVGGQEASEKIATALQGVSCDAVVITGTGMPALQAICDLQQQFGVPVFNSNLALAWACLRAAKVPLLDRAPEPGFPLLGRWQQLISRL